MSRPFVIALALASALVADAASAQVEVVEESESTQVVERGYVRGQGRGVQYGAHLVSPVYLSSVTPSGATRADAPVPVGGGFGLLARIGWEFPSGITLEVLGGFAANGVDTRGNAMSDVLMRADVGAGLRYMFFNETAFVPFVQLGGTVRWHFFDFVRAGNVEHASGDPTFAVHGAVGFQIELSPFFGIEAGCLVEWTAWGSTFEEPGYVSITPFAGVTLYVYDESGN